MSSINKDDSMSRMSKEQKIREEDRMSKEREHAENMVCQRFNFFLVFFAIILAAAFNAKTQLHLQLILFLGASISFFLVPTICSAQIVLNEIFEVIEAKKSTHPSKIVKDIIYKKWYGPIMQNRKPRNFIGYWIPILCCFALFLGLIFSICGKLHVPC